MELLFTRHRVSVKSDVKVLEMCNTANVLKGTELHNKNSLEGK